MYGYSVSGVSGVVSVVFGQGSSHSGLLLQRILCVNSLSSVI